MIDKITMKRFIIFYSMECQQGEWLDQGFRIKTIKTRRSKFRRNPSNYLPVKVFSPMCKQKESKGETTEASECGFAQQWGGAALQIITTGEITSNTSTWIHSLDTPNSCVFVLFWRSHFRIKPRRLLYPVSILDLPQFLQTNETAPQITP